MTSKVKYDSVTSWEMLKAIHAREVHNEDSPIAGMSYAKFCEIYKLFIAEMLGELDRGHDVVFPRIAKIAHVIKEERQSYSPTAGKMVVSPKREVLKIRAMHQLNSRRKNLNGE